MEEMETTSMDITKLVINNQTKTELHKSSPIKTYSKKSPDNQDGSAETCVTSRYGRQRKHNMSDDFLSTDHRLGNYLKQETVKEAVFKKASLDKKLHRTGKKLKKGRGRPRKSLPNLSLVSPASSPQSRDKDYLNKSLPAIDIATDYQAPVPTSRETLPLPAELTASRGESDAEDELHDADWNCGDLAWASVPSYPYWPCAITRDPTDPSFVKYSCIGRSTKPQMQLHVRFFGDNGRRSWVKSANLMPFTGLDDYQNMVEETCTPQLKRTDMKMYKMFTVAPSKRKGWQAAVSEAESLLASPRSERILYFETLYKTGEITETSDSVADLTPTLSKKRKLDQVRPPKLDVEKRLKVDRYSINLDTLALQAAPITPRAIYTIKRKVLVKNGKSAGKILPKAKRIYVKRSEKWLQCKNKIKTGIVADGPGPDSNSNSNSSYNSRFIMRVKQITMRGVDVQTRTVTLPLEDDFALPAEPETSLTDTPDIPEQPLPDPERLQVSKDVTALEFESQQLAPPILLNTELSASCSASLDAVDEVIMTDLTPIPQPTSVVALAKPDIPVQQEPDTQQLPSHDTTAPTFVSPVKRSKGRPRKNSLPSPSQLNTELSASCSASLDAVDEVIMTDLTPIPQPASLVAVAKSDIPVQQEPDTQQLPSHDTTAPTFVSPVKRGRGRPRKNSAASPSQIQTAGERKVCRRLEEKRSAASTPIRPGGRIGTKKSSSNNLSTVTPRPHKNSSKQQKIKESQSQDELVRKFGYKGSKVFKKFLELNFDKIVDERPDLSLKDVEKYIEDLWLRKNDISRQKFKSRVEAESESDFVVDKTPKSKSDVPLALPSRVGPGSSGTTTAYKKQPSLFQGIKLDRVCQVCLKGENLVRCKGPCVGFFHKECGETRSTTPRKGGETSDSSSSKKKRGRKRLQVLEKIEPKQEDTDSCPSEDLKARIQADSCDASQSSFDRSEITVKNEAADSKPNIDTEEQSSSQSHCSASSETNLLEDHHDTSESKIKLSQETENTSVVGKDNVCVDEKENVLPVDSTDLLTNGRICDDSFCKRKADEEIVKDCYSTGRLNTPDLAPSQQQSVNSQCNATDDASQLSDKLCENESEGGSDAPSAVLKTSKVQDPRNSDSESDNGKNKIHGGSVWKCLRCRQGVDDPCFICKGSKQEKMYRCCISSCGLLYHLSCVETWPQNHTMVGAKGRTVLTCPQHSCHTCISDNPKANMPKYNMDKLVKCLYCPTSYHHSNYCIPAGCEILSNSQIICSRHYEGSAKLHHVNAAWCFICSVGGSLICCDLCPNSFHVECLNIASPEGSFICEDCETGRYPLYGEIIWVKLGAYRWWPAKILFPSEIPDNIKLLPHKRGEFAIRFFGSHDYYWVNRGRVFLYHEGDGETVATKSRVDRIFNQAMIEARDAFTAFCLHRDQRQAVNKSIFKPPKYIKISKNVCQNSRLSSLLKPVEGYVANLTPCDCKPQQDSPCGPNSDCINRLLMIECHPQVCPAKDKCCNQNFEKRLYPSLTPFLTDSRGWGLKTNEPIKKGDFIIEYVGEIIDEEEYKRRIEEMQKKKNENYYFLTIDKDTMLDAGPKGNKARFMNHSCDPNCETQKWTVNGITRVGLFALKDIPKDTELVFNYQLETIGNNKVSCKCAAGCCSGFIGGTKAVNKTESSKIRNDLDRSKKPSNGNSGVKRYKRLNSRSGHKVTSDVCFICDEGGQLLLCDSLNCPYGYHLSCLRLSSEPTGEWICPVHVCAVCSQPKVKRCGLCINSYCSKHVQANLVRHKTHGFVCDNHPALSADVMRKDSADVKTWSKSNGNIATTKFEVAQSNSEESADDAILTQFLNGHLDLT